MADTAGLSLRRVRARSGAQRRHLTALDDVTAVSLDILPPADAAALLVRLSGRAGLSPGDPGVREITERVSGELTAAAGCHQESLETARAIGSPWDEAHALAGLGRCALADGQRARGRSCSGKRGNLRPDRGGRGTRAARRTAGPGRSREAKVRSVKKIWVMNEPR